MEVPIIVFESVSERSRQRSDGESVLGLRRRPMAQSEREGGLWRVMVRRVIVVCQWYGKV